MRLALGCIAVGRVGLVFGALVLAGCVSAPAPYYENPLDGYYGQGYSRPYGAPPPGYYWWYPYQYGPQGYPPSFIVVRDDRGDHDRHDDGRGPNDDRRDHDARDRDPDSVRPVPGRVPRTGERRPPPQVVPTKHSGQPVRLPPAGATEESDAVPFVREDGQRPAPVRRRGGSRPQTPLPEE
jgi:hypothetical protein